MLLTRDKVVLEFAVLLVSLVSLSWSADILAIIPTPSYSHQIAFVPLWRELSLRGHKVTVITTDPTNDPKLTNLTEINMKRAYNFFTNMNEIADSMTMWNIQESFLQMINAIIEEELSDPSVQDLIHNKRNFDVVIAEHFYPELLGFAEIYQTPRILIASLDTFGYVHNSVGNPSHPSVYPDLLTPFYPPLSFQERLVSTFFSWYTSYFTTYRNYPEKQKLMQKYFNTTTPVVNIMSDIDLLILNVNPVIQLVRALGPTTINIGGFRPGKTSSLQLSKDLKQFLDGANHGFIYFSLGSNIKSKDLGESTLRSIITALSEVPYKVLWKFEADHLPGQPNNVKLVKWAPQEQILAHPNIKLFVTQGGLQSMEEGIYSEVPFVVIPFFGDQEQNANLMRSKGIARIVNRKPFIETGDLKNAILEVINNPSYKNTVKKLKYLALDTPMTGIENAIWWIEYVVRHNGTKHLRNPIADLPSYQYYLLDVVGFLIALMCLIIWITILLAKLLLRGLTMFISILVIDKEQSKLKEQ
ncbi:hypothetical protein NQ318_021878 [Aromia moschata]|uniref:Glucuronosyltransferase n=1 Tax=Aromia moschata TaxID=1265417 RepID=A0AAV8Z833_9CUCU|nr:hypothetical protein NQ318_021878 [Aromia moschata]